MISVREAKYEEMALAASIMVTSFRTAFADFVSQETMDACTNPENCRAMLESIYQEGKMHFLMGGDQGFLCWQETADGTEIVAIHSLPESWGTGLGHAMLTEALKRIGDRTVILWAFKDNTRARRFYEKHGLRWDGTERVSEFDGALEVRYVRKYTAKMDVFFENARLLQEEMQIVPLLYGSLGLEYLTKENLSADDIDILIPEVYLSEQWVAFRAMLERNGYRLIDEHEHTFEKGGIHFSYARLEELESFAGIVISNIPILEASHIRFRLLTLEQYLKVYTASSKDGYRMNVKEKKDQEKIDFIRSRLGVEVWDAYYADGILAGRDLIRGEPIPEGLHHLVSEILVRHTDGDYLLMQRDPRKPNYGGFYEATAGGSALKGEDSFACAARELREETGIESSQLTKIGRFVSHDTIYENFLCVTDCRKDSVKLQEGETVSYKWLSEAEFIGFVNSDAMIDVQYQRYEPYLKHMGYIK